MSDDWAKDLSKRERAFVEEYLVDLNGCAAVRRCGFAADGHPQSINNLASIMLAKPHVAAAIETLLRERGVTRVWIIDQYGKIADACLDDYMTVKGGQPIYYDWDQIPKEKLRLIKSWKQSKDGEIEIELINAKPAVDRLAKLLRMEVERTEISGPDGGPVEMSNPADEVKRQLDVIAKRRAVAKKGA